MREETQRRQSISAHVWRDSFTRGLDDWDIPLVALEALGIRLDSDGLFESEELVPLRPGAEASPFLDRDQGVVYKLFDVRSNGSLGKKLRLKHLSGNDGYDLVNDDADVIHTVQKLAAINEAGGHPTEIVGFADTGDFLIAKQPLATDYHDFHQDLTTACISMHALFPGRANLGRSCAVFHALDRCWLLADLHKGNVMIDADGRPTIIDALVGSIPPGTFRHLPWLKEACADALTYRTTGQKPSRDLFDGIHDDDL